MRTYISGVHFVIFLFHISYIDCCPDKPSDFLIIIKASYYLSDYQWESVKHLLGKLSSAVNLGRTSETSQIGVYLYDNLNMPAPVIEIGSYGRSSDLKTAMSKLKLLPCGTWCSEQEQKTDAEQIASILTKQAFKRPAKIFIIGSEYVDNYSLQTLLTTSNNFVIQQVLIPQTPGVVTYESPYYNYYRAYYDNYRRYASRMEQIYPYMHVEIPADQYPFVPQNDRYGHYDYDSWASSSCYSLIGCLECMTAETAIAPSVDSTAETIETSEDSAPTEILHSGDSKDNSNKFNLNKKLSAELVTIMTSSQSTSQTEDYEYEITADPPGVNINKTPLLDEVNEKSVDEEDLL